MEFHRKHVWKRFGLFYDFKQNYSKEESLAVIEDFMLRTCFHDNSPPTFHFWFFAAQHSSRNFIEKLTAKVDEDGEFANVFYKKLFDFRNEIQKGLLDYAQESESNPVILWKEKLRTSVSTSQSRV
jgi:hypothetical protein